MNSGSPSLRKRVGLWITRQFYRFGLLKHPWKGKTQSLDSSERNRPGRRRTLDCPHCGDDFPEGSGQTMVHGQAGTPEEDREQTEFCSLECLLGHDPDDGDELEYRGP